MNCHALRTMTSAPVHPFPVFMVYQMNKLTCIIARRLLGDETHQGNLARHEWFSLAHDDIGACEVGTIPCYTEFKS